MNLLALDLGSSVGLATSFRGWTDQLSGNREQKLMEFKRILQGGYLAPFDFDVVVYERPFARGLAATRFLWGMAGVVEAVATENGAAVLDVLPSTIKKWATGNGRATKGEMIEAASRLRPHRRFTEHEADAVCLWHYTMEKAVVG